VHAKLCACESFVGEDFLKQRERRRFLIGFAEIMMVMVLVSSPGARF
jgi:hypothetical protein